MTGIMERAKDLEATAERIGSDLNIETALLIDIARSLRTLIELSKAGMEFSHSLADKFE